MTTHISGRHRGRNYPKATYLELEREHNQLVAQKQELEATLSQVAGRARDVYIELLRARSEIQTAWERRNTFTLVDDERIDS